MNPWYSVFKPKQSRPIFTRLISDVNGTKLEQYVSDRWEEWYCTPFQVGSTERLACNLHSVADWSVVNLIKKGGVADKFRMSDGDVILDCFGNPIASASLVDFLKNSRENRVVAHLLLARNPWSPKFRLCQHKPSVDSPSLPSIMASVNPESQDTCKTKD